MRIALLALLVLVAACRQPGGQGMNADVARALAAGAPRATLRVGSVAIEIARIPPGELAFGSPPTETERRSSEGRGRRTRISKAFYLGRTEVTQAAWRAVMGSLRTQPPGDDLPVAQVSFRDALAFVAALSKRTGLSVRLPTEAEWEYACRAGTTTRYWSGDKEADLARVGWYRENAGGRAHPVGEKPDNPWGLFDMHGNVWEYCADYIEDFDQLPAVDPVGSRTDWRGALRGGGWMHDAAESRSAARLVSDDMFGGAGLRIAVDP